MSSDWPFPDPENAAVYTLDRVLRKETSILRVRHDPDDGAWPFLDDGDADPAAAKLVTLASVVDLDPTLGDLADLPAGWFAEREAIGEPWRRSPLPEADEEFDANLIAGIREQGWQVLMIPEDEEGPAFAYSVGLFRSFGHPEIIILGLDLDLMHALVNNMAEDVQNGAVFTPGQRSDDVLEGHPVEFRAVTRSRYREYLGYACWFHDGEDFPAIQCVWPDMRGRFPNDPEAPEEYRARQPLLDA